MVQLAFVVASEAGSVWSDLIAKTSNSPYSHVELWLDGPQNAARCFSSREPLGASFMVRDLATPEWEIVHLPPTLYHGSQLEDCMIEAYCQGANGKEYDLLGLAGIGTGTGAHSDADVFCSEFVSGCLKFCLGIMLSKVPWMESPGMLYSDIKDTQ